VDDEPALARFKQGPLELSADVSGVIVTAGYVVTVRSTGGVTVFARPIGGFMGQVSVAGERFTFAAVDPADEAGRAPRSIDSPPRPQ
jgi:hypothetical protein